MSLVLDDILGEVFAPPASRPPAASGRLSGPAPMPLAPPAEQSTFFQGSGAAAYRLLTGSDPAEAAIADNRSFDEHIFACILSAAAAELAPLTDTTGLAAHDLVALFAEWFPHLCLAAEALASNTAAADDEEMAMVRDLLGMHRSTGENASRFLAAMVARRAMEPNHLWEDLGLRDRSELTRLLMRHFAPIAARNTQNMRWKRFLYRALCEAEGLIMCKAPVCTSCSDFSICFGEESGASRLIGSREASPLDARTLCAPDSRQGALSCGSRHG